MHTHPLVSVVLGTYNGEKFLKEQIESILQQTYGNIELIITDDCSTDHTPAILKEYLNQDKKVQVRFNEKNLGLIKNFEKAVQYAKGDYIAFADQDDIWLPEKIHCLLEHIGDSMLIYSDSAYIDAAGRLMGKKLSDFRNPVRGKNLYALDSESGIWVAAHALMFRRELLDLALPFPDHISHDGWMAYIAMLKGGITFVPETLVLYRQHGGNMVGGLGCHRMMKVKKKKNKSGRSKNRLQQENTGRIDALLSRITAEDAEFIGFLNKMRAYTAHPVLSNRIRRMLLRLKYVHRIYAPRKRNIFRKVFRIIKSF